MIAYGHYHAHHVRQMDDKLLINVASVGLGWYGLAALIMFECFSDQHTVRQYQVPYDMAEHERLIKERRYRRPHPCVRHIGGTDLAGSD